MSFFFFQFFRVLILCAHLICTSCYPIFVFSCLAWSHLVHNILQPEIPYQMVQRAFFMKRKGGDQLLKNREKLTLKTVICHPYLLICLLWISYLMLVILKSNVLPCLYKYPWSLGMNTWLFLYQIISCYDGISPTLKFNCCVEMVNFLHGTCNRWFKHCLNTVNRLTSSLSMQRLVSFF